MPAIMASMFMRCCVSSYLQGMTQIELIVGACPIMTVYHKRGGKLGYSGHVLHLPQNNLQFIHVESRIGIILASINHAISWIPNKAKSVNQNPRKSYL